MRTLEDLAQATDPERIGLRGALRRMVVTLTSKAIWQLVGYVLPSADGVQKEVVNAEAFGGIGFYARPPSSGKPEAIVIMLGADQRTPVIVGVRDEATRAAIAGALLEDETATFNSKTILQHKADGTIEGRSKNGTAAPFATLEDLQILRDALDAAVVTLGANGINSVGVLADTAAKVATGDPHATWPIGTKVIKGE